MIPSVGIQSPEISQVVVHNPNVITVRTEHSPSDLLATSIGDPHIEFESHFAVTGNSPFLSETDFEVGYLSSSGCTWLEAVEEGLHLSRVLGGAFVKGIHQNPRAFPCLGNRQNETLSLLNNWSNFFAKSPNGIYFQYFYGDAANVIASALTCSNHVSRIILIGINPSVSVNHERVYEYRSAMHLVSSRHQHVVTMPWCFQTGQIGLARFLDSTFVASLQFPVVDTLELQANDASGCWIPMDIIVASRGGTFRGKIPDSSNLKERLARLSYLVRLKIQIGENEFFWTQQRADRLSELFQSLLRIGHYAALVAVDSSAKDLRYLLTGWGTCSLLHLVFVCVRRRGFFGWSIASGLAASGIILNAIDCAFNLRSALSGDQSKNESSSLRLVLASYSISSLFREAILLVPWIRNCSEKVTSALTSLPMKKNKKQNSTLKVNQAFYSSISDIRFFMRIFWCVMFSSFGYVKVGKDIGSSSHVYTGIQAVLSALMLSFLLLSIIIFHCQPRR